MYTVINNVIYITCNQKKLLNKDSSTNFKWYIISTQSGLENKVKKDLLRKIERESLKRYFGRILTPSEIIRCTEQGINTMEVKRYFPGYIMLEFYLNNRNLLLIKKTPNVLGFVGQAKIPSSLNGKEIRKIYQIIKKAGVSRQKNQYKSGSYVKINKGPFINFNGIIKTVNFEKGRIKVIICIFGRLATVELNFSYINKKN